MDYVDIEDGYMDVGEEAHYWFSVSDFADLSRHYGLDKMLKDVIELRDRLDKKGNHDSD
jgi:hypothetical protein